MATTTKPEKASSNSSTAAVAQEWPGYSPPWVESLPNGWKVAPLSELGVFIKGKGILKVDLIPEGLPCVTYGELYTKHHLVIEKFHSFIPRELAEQSTRLEKNDILFAGSGETAAEIGKCAAYLSDEEAYAGGDVVIFRQKEVDAHYLSLVLNSQTLVHQRARLGQGHSVVHIYPDLLGEQVIPLAPVDERHRIAATVGTWDAAMAKLEQLIAAKQRRKQGLMQELLSGKRRFPGFTEKWHSLPLSKLGDITSGGTPDTTVSEYWNGGIPWYTPTEITALNGRVFITACDRTLSAKGLANCSATLLPAGAIVVCTRATVGQAAMLSLPGTTNQGFKNIVPNDQVDGRFLFYQLMMNQHQMQRLACGSTFPELSMWDFRNIKVPVPGIDEQQTIAACVMAAEAEIERHIEKHTHLTTQKRGLMQQLLTGRCG